MVGHTWEQVSRPTSWKNRGEVGKSGIESDKGLLTGGPLLETEVRVALNEWRIAEGFLKTAVKVIIANICFECFVNGRCFQIQ